MRITIQSVRARALAIVMLAMAMMAATAAIAWASPTGVQTMSLSELQTKLDASGGTLDGYLKTVVKGSDIEEIPVRVLAITLGSDLGPTSLTSLILFEAYGTEIDKIGGIAAGMSGSPIYVEDGGIDKIIGALSYGDSMTLGGTGLATPIESMQAVQSDYGAASASVLTLPESVLTDGGLKDRVIVTSDPEKYADQATDGAIIAEPLSKVFIGGISPSSKMYKSYANYLDERGLDVVSLTSGLSSIESTYDAPFEPGSAISVLASRGDLWIGGIGTVTYADDGTVLAFGHPMYWSGESDLFMGNAWIDGIWPSTWEPYKLGRPAALRGTITQDRLAGVMGEDGTMPTAIPVTAKATVRETGQTAETTVTIPAGVIDSSSDDYYGLPAIAAYVAGSRVYDSYYIKGSAITTTTVVVNDGSNTYTITRKNVFDSDYDITYSAINDVDEIVTSLQTVGANGVAHPRILSVSLETEFSSQRKLAEIKSISVPGGLHYGTNWVRVSYLRFGDPTLKTAGVRLVIPHGVPLTGAIEAYGSEGSYSDYYDYLDYEELFDYYDDESGGYIDVSTVKDAVDELSETPSNGRLTVSFQPTAMSTSSSDDDEDESDMSAASTTYDAITAGTTLDAVLVSSASMDAPTIYATFSPSSKLSYNGSVYLAGGILGAEYGTGTVRVTRQYVGDSGETTLATVKLDDDSYFASLLSSLKKNATIRLHYSGDVHTLPVSKAMSVKVKAKVSVKSSAKRVKKGKRVTLTASVAPADTGGSVVFERYSHGRWKRIASTTVVNGKASYSYKPPAGTIKIRARTTGSSKNIAKTSSSIKIKVIKK